MWLLDELRAEHDLIDRVVGSLRAYVALRADGAGDPAHAAGFVAFLRLYAGDYHHGREETILFQALVERARLPRSGPVDTLVGDHHRIATMLDEVASLIVLDPLDPPSASRLASATTAYGAALGHHIDAENSVLLPECEPRLRHAGVRELPSREMTADERAAKLAGEALVERYPALEDRQAIRGEGCVCCPAFGEECRGLEHEWWNEWEWAEFEEHLGDG